MNAPIPPNAVNGVIVVIGSNHSNRGKAIGVGVGVGAEGVWDNTTAAERSKRGG